jgi:hypothetical protein
VPVGNRSDNEPRVNRRGTRKPSSDSDVSRWDGRS